MRVALRRASFMIGGRLLTAGGEQSSPDLDRDLCARRRRGWRRHISHTSGRRHARCRPSGLSGRLRESGSLSESRSLSESGSVSGSGSFGEHRSLSTFQSLSGSGSFGEHRSLSTFQSLSGSGSFGEHRSLSTFRSLSGLRQLGLGTGRGRGDGTSARGLVDSLAGGARYRTRRCGRGGRSPIGGSWIGGSRRACGH